MANSSSGPTMKHWSALQLSDHIYKWRSIGIFCHHGIVVGPRMVIDFQANEGCTKRGLKSSSSGTNSCRNCDGKWRPHGVNVVCFDCFLLEEDKEYINFYRYGVPLEEAKKEYKRGGTCSLLEEDSDRFAVVARAYYLLVRGFGDYDFLKHNCETFAVYCKTSRLFTDAARGSAQTHGFAAFLYRSLSFNIIQYDWYDFSGPEYTVRVEVEQLKEHLDEQAANKD